MKLQNLSIIFLVIMIPIMLVVSYYIQLQIDTITLQTTYDSKLIAATKDAIEAFEINTVEWNNKYSGVSGSKRRDIEASINTFMTTLADGLGVSGINREYIEGYIPAILYTLNDGYYIYTPTETYETLKDEDGVDVVFDENNDKITFSGTKPADGTILYEVKSGVGEGTFTYENSKGETITKNFTTNPTESTAKKTYEHTLLPLISYSEQVGDKTINYTLDNYIKVSGEFICDTNYANYGGDKSKPLVNTGDKRQGTKLYVQEEGHLVYNFYDIMGKSIDNIRYKSDSIDVKIDPEILSENVCYIDDSGNYQEKNFSYIYIEDSQGDKTKLYYNTTSGPTGNNWFTMNSKDKRVFLSDSITNVTQYVYKKVSLPSLESGDTGRYINFYQVLNGDIKGNWYADWNDNGELPPSEQVSGTTNATYGLNTIDPEEDCSAIKYYVQAYYFTRWVNECVAKDMGGKPFSESEVNDNPELENLNHPFKEIFTINEENNPDDVNSKFSKHKRKAIENQVNDSLAQAIRNYAGETAEGYRLPELTANDWDQILSNVSMVTFMQQIPVGFKTYNNYAIATSTNNKEYVDPNEIYFINSADDYYHRCYCDKTVGIADLIGYRSIDFVERNYTKVDGEKEETKYYYLHSNDLNSSMACYYCLVNRADYTENITTAYTTAYNTALARERYKSKQDVIIAKEYAEFEVAKEVFAISDDHGTVGDEIAEVGDTITWKITISNKGRAAGTAYVYDKMPDGLSIINIDEVKANFVDDDKRNISINGIYGNVYVSEGTTKVIFVKTEVTSSINLGQLTNIVILKNEETSDISIDQASADVKAEKTVTIDSSGGASGSTFMVLVLDCSTSITKSERDGIRDSARRVIDKIKEKGIKYELVSFAQGASELNSIEDYKLVNSFAKGNGFSTNYVGALTLANEIIKKNSGYENYYVVFMSDGGPTNTQTEFYGWENNNVVGEFFEAIIKSVTSVPLAVIGGWCECLWISPDIYTMNWLLVELANEITNEIGFQIINVVQIEKFFQKILGPLDANKWVAKAAWEKILNKISEFEAYNAIFATMYFDNADIKEISDARAYGLEQMADTWDDGTKAFYRSENASDFEDDLYDIINKIIGPEIPKKEITSNLGKIKLDNVSSIKSITIGETILSSDRVNQIIENIKNSESYNSTDDSGDLNLNDYPELKTTEDITILY